MKPFELIKNNWVLFHKIFVSIKCYILLTSWQCTCGAQIFILLFQLLTPILSISLKRAGVNPKNVSSKRNNQENERVALMAPKRANRYPARFYSKKEQISQKTKNKEITSNIFVFTLSFST